jgi:Protein of unknown function (DUF2917)
MVCEGYTKVWDLASGELVQLDGARGTTLRVTRGTLWITLEDDVRDVVLEAGDVFTIDRRGLTLIEAHSNATVCVMARHVEAVRLRQGRRPPAARFADWLASAVAAFNNRRWVPYL